MEKVIPCGANFNSKASLKACVKNSKFAGEGPRTTATIIKVIAANIC